MLNKSSDCEVIIAGGGPVGLCLALLLSRAGVTVRVFEAEPAISLDLRASTFHPPTLDLLEPYGVTGDLVARGLVRPHWQIRLHPDGDRAVFDLSVLAGETRHPYRLQCEQWKLSESLLAHLQKEGNAEVIFGAAVTEVTQDEHSASITVETSAGLQNHRARFVIGADGARSLVRKAMDLPFEGETYPETTLLVTTLFPFEEHLEGLSNVTYCWKRDGNFSLLKVPGRWRVSIYPREDLSIEEQLSEEMIEASLQEIVPRAQAYEVIEKRPYRVHQRIVDKYNKGRLALAGDAAHLNSPSGGMGLNGGVHDAFELAAALTDMLRHGAPLERLDLYDRKRRPIARDQIIAQADRNRARMREKDPEKRRELLADLQAIVNDRQRLHAYLLRSSMLALQARAASITLAEAAA
jgi:3-(3-hydroxy-phenyl)propionate hydroxylase